MFSLKDLMINIIITEEPRQINFIKLSLKSQQDLRYKNKR